MKAIIIVAVALVAAIGAGSANAAVSYLDPMLGQEMHQALIATELTTSHLRVRNVYVRCYTSESVYDAATSWRTYGEVTNVWAYQQGATVYMRPSTCSAAKRFMRKLGSGSVWAVTQNEVAAYSTLLHESYHVQGIHNEKTTECLANDGVRWVANGHYGINMSESNRLTRLAFDWSARNVAYSYWMPSGKCQSWVRSLDWGHFTNKT